MVRDLVPRYAPEQQGRCVSCGFLAERRMGNDEAFGWRTENWTVDRASRESGPIGGLACFLDVAPLTDEWNDQMQTDRTLGPVRAALAVINKDRACSAWTAFIPSLTPRDHFEHERLSMLERDRVALTLQIEGDRKAWEKALSDERAASETRATRQLIAIGLTGLAIGVVAFLPEPVRAHLYDVIIQTAAHLVGELASGFR